MAQVKEPFSGTAQILLPAADLDESIGFFRDQLGFRLEMIFPADAPRVAVMSGWDLWIRLDTRVDPTRQKIRIESTSEALRGRLGPVLTAPGGVVIELAEVDTPVDVPSIESEYLLTPPATRSAWSAGRAGMQYRDLIPGRLGGAVIASHIRIPEGGPVPDYVHHHHIRFQLIYCLRGWTRLVYEDQGSPFVMQAGDCVLQPPHIRHRVLECSDGFEVVEVGCPAEHQTLVDHELELPSPGENRERDFGGQKFIFHQSAPTPWVVEAGMSTRDTGLREASAGAVDVRACRPAVEGEIRFRQTHPLYFGFVVAGSGRLIVGQRSSDDLQPEASFVIPADTEVELSALSSDFEFLQVRADP